MEIETQRKGEERAGRDRDKDQSHGPSPLEPKRGSAFSHSQLFEGKSDRNSTEERQTHESTNNQRRKVLPRARARSAAPSTSYQHGPNHRTLLRSRKAGAQTSATKPTMHSNHFTIADSPRPSLTRRAVGSDVASVSLRALLARVSGHSEAAGPVTHPPRFSWPANDHRNGIMSEHWNVETTKPAL